LGRDYHELWVLLLLRSLLVEKGPAPWARHLLEVWRTKEKEERQTSSARGGRQEGRGGRKTGAEGLNTKTQSKPGPWTGPMNG